MVQRLPIRILWQFQHWGDVESAGFPMLNCSSSFDHLDMADCFLQRAESECRKVLADFFSDELEEVDDELWLAAETTAEHGVLSSDSDRACVEVTHTHHDATAHDQGCCCESELFCSKQCRNDDITTCLHLSVSLDHNAVAQSVQQQCLLCFSKTELPRCTRMLERCQRRCTSSTVMA